MFFEFAGWLHKAQCMIRTALEGGNFPAKWWKLQADWFFARGSIAAAKAQLSILVAAACPHGLPMSGHEYSEVAATTRASHGLLKRLYLGWCATIARTA